MKRVQESRAGRAYCGPTAIAALTHGDYERVAESIMAQRMNMQRPRGMTSRELQRVLRSFGVRTRYFSMRGPAWRMLRPNRRAVLVGSRHFVAADGLLLCDTNAGPTPDHPKRGMRLVGVVLVEEGAA